MTVRLGIELTPSRCSLVSVQDGQYGSVVRDFQSIEYGPGDASELHQELRRLVAAGRFQQAARVVLWDARSLHLSMTAPVRTPHLEAYAVAHARREAPAFGNWASNAWAGTATGRAVDLAEGGPGRELLFASMSAEDVRRLLRPLQRAGLAIETVMTPALALTGLAASGGAEHGGLVAFVAMNRDMGAITIMQGSRLLLERRFAWSFRADQAGTEQRLAERYSFAARMAAELRPSFDEARMSAGTPVAYVVAFGDIPNLRSVAMPLTDELDVEVETLDSLAGIDADQLPNRSDLFREQVASLRMAWAAGARSPLIRLTPPTRWEPLSQRSLRVAVGGMAAAAAVLVVVSLWPDALTREVVMPDRTLVERGMNDTDAVAAPTTGASRPPEPTASPERFDPAPRVADRAGDRAFESVPSGESTAERRSRLMPAPAVEGAPAADAESRDEPVSASMAGSSDASTAGAIDESRDEIVAVDDRPPVEPRESPSRASADESAPRLAAAAEPRPLPVVRSILYSSERRLAFIGRQIVGVGDVVDGMVVVDITPDSVVLRLPSGEERRVNLRADVGGSTR